MSKAAKKKEKQEWVMEKPKLANAQKPRGNYFIDPEDGEYKETIKNARKKLESPLEAARARKLRETVTSENTNSHHKTKCVCIVEAHKSTRKLLRSTLPRNHENHITEKGFNSIHHYNLMHKCLPIPQPMKNQMQKPQ